MLAYIIHKPWWQATRLSWARYVYMSMCVQCNICECNYACTHYMQFLVARKIIASLSVQRSLNCVWLGLQKVPLLYRILKHVNVSWLIYKNESSSVLVINPIEYFKLLIATHENWFIHILMSLPKVSNLRELGHSADESCSENNWKFQVCNFMFCDQKFKISDCDWFMFKGVLHLLPQKDPKLACFLLYHCVERTL